MVTLTLGTKEYFPIKIVDVLGNLTTLDATGLEFDLFKDDEDETEISTGTASANDGMIALPLIDTTAWDDDDEGDYSLFLRFTLAPEVPRLGPFKFRVDD